MSIIPAVERHDRRRQGRPRNPNRKPNDAHLACRREDIDELDRIIGYSNMPLGVKFSTLIQEYKQLKKAIGLPISNNRGLSIQTQLVNDTYYPDNESILQDADLFKKLWKEFDNK